MEKLNTCYFFRHNWVWQEVFKGKDGDIEYENIEKKKRGHRNGNIEKLLKSGELWLKMLTSNLTSKVPHKTGHIKPQNRSYKNTLKPVI